MEEIISFQETETPFKYPIIPKDKLFEYLIQVAAKSPAKKRKVGAVIAASYGNEYIIYSEGYNFNLDGGPCETEDNVTHPNVQHAEVSAILNLDNNISELSNAHKQAIGLIMFTTYEPCAGCRALLAEINLPYKVVDKIYKQPTNTLGVKMETGIDKTLKERGSRYGDFSDNARVSEGIINVLIDETGWGNLRDVHKAALNVIAQKMARIVNGDPEYKDNWHDIAGYAKLVEDRCIENVKEDTNATDK